MDGLFDGSRFDGISAGIRGGRDVSGGGAFLSPVCDLYSRLSGIVSEEFPTIPSMLEKPETILWRAKRIRSFLRFCRSAAGGRYGSGKLCKSNFDRDGT